MAVPTFLTVQTTSKSAFGLKVLPFSGLCSINLQANGSGVGVGDGLLVGLRADAVDVDVEGIEVVPAGSEVGMVSVGGSRVFVGVGRSVAGTAFSFLL